MIQKWVIQMNALLNRLLLWQKFTLLGLFSIVLVAVPLTLYVNESNKALDTAETEARGIEPTRAVLALVLLAQQHRDLSALMLAGNEAAQGQRAAKQDEVEKAFAATDAI